MITSVSGDKRLLVLLIGWCFGGFMEGMAGFGTAIAIPAGMLAGMGFPPLLACLVCLVANGTPTPFGSIGHSDGDPGQSGSVWTMRRWRLRNAAAGAADDPLAVSDGHPHRRRGEGAQRRVWDHADFRAVFCPAADGRRIFCRQ